jgi:hypothetical protein
MKTERTQHSPHVVLGKENVMDDQEMCIYEYGRCFMKY